MSLTILAILVCGGFLALATIIVLVIWLQNRQTGMKSQTGLSKQPPLGNSGLEQSVRYWLERGNKIEAIKVYRQAVDVSLKEAKEAIEDFERRGTLTGPRVYTPETQENIETQIYELLQANQKIEAIRVYREATDCGLAEAKDAVEAFDRGEPLALPGTLHRPQANPENITADLEERVRALLQQKQKIVAIKIYREAVGCGLKEAKDAVEAIEKNL